MPVIGDIIKTSFQQELDGVAISNDITWRVVDLGIDPGTLISLVGITDLYHLAWDGPVTTQSVISCAVYENLSAPEGKQVIFPAGKTGVLLTGSHPQDQVLRFNEYARVLPAGNVVNGAYNLSGVGEDKSTNGLLNDAAVVEPLRNFLIDEVTLGTGWTIQPVQVYQSTRGKMDGAVPSADLTDTTKAYVPGSLVGRTVFNDTDGSQAVITANTATIITGVLGGGTLNIWTPGDSYHITPADFAFADMIQCVVNPRFLKLQSRKTRLCAVG